MDLRGDYQPALLSSPIIKLKVIKTAEMSPCNTSLTRFFIPNDFGELSAWKWFLKRIINKSLFSAHCLYDKSPPPPRPRLLKLYISASLLLKLNRPVTPQWVIVHFLWFGTRSCSQLLIQLQKILLPGFLLFNTHHTSSHWTFYSDQVLFSLLIFVFFRGL